jgi:PAS domain S-box-containing protein
MNIYALLSLLASIISISLAAGLYAAKRKAILNKLVILILLVNAYWAFGESMLRQADSLESAVFWVKVISFFPLLLPLLVHAALVFTENNQIKKKYSLILLYTPTLLLSFLQLTTDLLFSPVLRDWGYTFILQTGSVVSFIFIMMIAGMAVFSIVQCCSYIVKVQDKTKKKQAKFVTIGVGIAVILAFLTNSLLPLLNVPSLATVINSLVGLIITFILLNFNILNISPEIAAENIVSSMPDSLILSDMKGTIITVNRVLLKLTGQKENDLVGKSIYNELKVNVENYSSAERLKEFLEELKSKKNVSDVEIKFLVPSGEEKTGLLSGSVVKNKVGENIGMVIIIRDITSRIEMEQKLVKAERFASIGELAGMVGHDLRNPLTSIRGAAFYLKNKHAGHLDEKDSSMFTTIDKSIDYSNKIINDLLDYSRELHLLIEKVPPQMLLSNALTFLEIPENIKIINLTTAKPELSVDVAKLSRVFVNVIKNAFEAMPKGGTLTIKSELSDNNVTFTFADTGVGMDKATLEKIWIPLFTTKAKGMGFGLPICKRYVEAHGGKIHTESQHGLGTTISLTIPINPTKTDLPITPIQQA